MSVAFAPAAVTRGSSRWLLLGSLALNLFFVGVAVAIAVRAPTPPSWDRNVFVRVERLAASLPPADADILRNQIQANHAAIEGAQTQYQTARSQIRETLRQDPFKADDMRAAMAATRAARQNFDQVIQGVFADAAGQMSSAGRHALADWRSKRNSAGNGQ
jgi:uncharacterized membrane protein